MDGPLNGAARPTLPSHGAAAGASEASRASHGNAGLGRTEPGCARPGRQIKEDFRFMKQSTRDGAGTASVLIFNEAAHDYQRALAPFFPAVEFLCAGTRDEALRLAPKAQAIFAYAQQIDHGLVAAAHGLRWIQALTTGTDAIAALTNLGVDVTVTSTRGIHGPQMAEMAFMYMLTLSRNCRRMWNNQRDRIWQGWPQPLLWKKTVTILGVGAIAEALASRCKAFDMTVVGVSGAARSVDNFDRIFTRDRIADAVALADYFIILVPHSASTDRIVNAEVLAAMKPDAYLINLARGGVVDEAALLQVLQRQAIAGAGLDVFAVEPLPSNHAFWAMENVIISPHLGGLSDIYVDQVVPVLRANLQCFLAGAPHCMGNIVDLRAGRG
jgi:D-2-hydroxyacid dehydrogenase (NADP+)